MTSASWILRYQSSCWKGHDGASTAWLSERELGEVAHFGNRQRRGQWLAGRWLAKTLLRALSGVSDFRHIEVLSRGGANGGDRPRVLIMASRWPNPLSISHTNRGTLVGVSTGGRCRVGVDLVEFRRFRPSFGELWFSASERAWMADDPGRRGVILWSLKESIYKAWNAGERWSPRAIEVNWHRPDRISGTYWGQTLPSFSVRVRERAGQIATLVSMPVRNAATDSPAGTY